MLFAIYLYARKVIKNRTTNEIENVDGGSSNYAIPMSMAENDLQIRIINAINCLIKQNDENASKFQDHAGQLDMLHRLDIQIKNIVRKTDTIEQKN